ncbi:MAG: winged helix-turn-helix transcriptional regulator [Nitrososphaerota archaeon]
MSDKDITPPPSSTETIQEGKEKRKIRELTMKEIEMIRELWKSNYTPTEISQMLNLPITTVRKYIAQFRKEELIKVSNDNIQKSNALISVGKEMLNFWSLMKSTIEEEAQRRMREKEELKKIIENEVKEQLAKQQIKINISEKSKIDALLDEILPDLIRLGLKKFLGEQQNKPIVEVKE